ncbi:haloacid dehalogenase type II [Roseomonas nepalensis]|uniref:Haloacid dehalogenase type II n=1 Tax=Muricoccus nepalensis TaxID=1854500 RepID=A0A502GJ95_9PROT|nr:haloacid dehalogenase type II [Roseomonas nepalensis]TPG61380.1 haloacid dehalogenase type II [Roseomonas nepalensis]
MTPLRPKFITFDCYGTLTNFQMGPLAREHFAGRVPAERMEAFLGDFTAYRLDEVLGAWKPYAEVLDNAVRRALAKHGVPYEEADGARFSDAVPGWGPHPDVAEPLARVAKEFPLVILSNAANHQIHANVAKLGAPFHAVFTAEQAGAYKPRMRAFEYMLGELGARPEELLHVSSSFRYDLMTAHDLGIRDKAWVNRGHEPRGNAFYGYHEIPDIGGLPGLLGL